MELRKGTGELHTGGHLIPEGPSQCALQLHKVKPEVNRHNFNKWWQCYLLFVVTLPKTTQNVTPSSPVNKSDWHCTHFSHSSCGSWSLFQTCECPLPPKAFIFFPHYLSNNIFSRLTTVKSALFLPLFFKNWCVWCSAIYNNWEDIASPGRKELVRFSTLGKNVSAVTLPFRATIPLYKNKISHFIQVHIY